MAVRVRDDFVGCVYVGGVAFQAGDVLPDGAVVGEHITGPVESEATIKTGEAVVGGESETPNTGANDEAVEGVPSDVAVADEPGGDGEEAAGLFDPSQHNAPEVHEYLKANPDDVQRVLELEAAGKARRGIFEVWLPK